MCARSRSASVPMRSPLSSTATSMAMRACALAACALLWPGCTLAPAGTDDEFRRLDEAGAAWRLPPGERTLPELSEQPDVDDVVARALLANGELEAAFNAWRAALQRVLVASGWPNTDTAIGLNKLLQHGGLWDTSAVTLGFDPMQMLLLPDKVRKAGEVAFAEALAAGRRFEAVRVELRERTLIAWWDWVLLGERLAVQERRVALVESLASSASASVSVGGRQSLVLGLGIEAGMARVALDDLRAELQVQRATLNALLAREPDAPLLPPEPGSGPAPRPLPSDEDIFATGVAANPGLAELAAMTAAREAALELADKRHEPNLAPNFTATGGGSESLGLMITLPTTVPAVEAAVKAARADLDEARARQAQSGRDATGALLATLAALHNDERRLARLAGEIAPGARALFDNARTAYATGQADLTAWVEAQQSVLDVELATAEARTAREQRLARLERLTGTELRAMSRTQQTPASLATGAEP